MFNVYAARAEIIRRFALIRRTVKQFRQTMCTRIRLSHFWIIVAKELEYVRRYFVMGKQVSCNMQRDCLYES